MRPESSGLIDSGRTGETITASVTRDPTIFVVKSDIVRSDSEGPRGLDLEKSLFIIKFLILPDNDLFSWKGRVTPVL